MKERAFRADAREAKGLHDGSITRVVRVLDPQPVFPFGVKRILLFPDPFHDKALAGTPAEGMGNKGPQELQWHCEDFAGNLVAKFDADSPLGVIGDRLWVQEMFGWVDHIEHGDPPVRQATNPADGWEHGVLDHAECPDFRWCDGDGFQAENKDGSERSEWKSCTQMPRWVSRTLLDVTDVRVERLQDVTEEDALAAGLEAHTDEGITYYGPLDQGDARPVEAFRKLFSKAIVEADPWLWLGTVAKVEA